MVPRWEPIDTKPVSRLYNQNGRGISIYINDLTILDWFDRTISHDRWAWFDYSKTLTMTADTYTMFLLVYG